MAQATSNIVLVVIEGFPDWGNPTDTFTRIRNVYVFDPNFPTTQDQLHQVASQRAANLSAATGRTHSVATLRQYEYVTLQNATR